MFSRVAATLVTFHIAGASDGGLVRGGGGWPERIVVSVKRLSVPVILLALLAAACSSPTSSSATSTAVAPTTAATTSDPVTASTTTLGATASTIVPPPSGPIVIAESAEEIGVQIGGSPLPFTLNPFLAGDWWRLSTRLDPLLFGGAWEPGAGGEPVADLVESLPDLTNGTAQRSADGSVTLSYRIRSDARWADGMPVSSDDFELTLRILQEDALQIRDD